MKKLSKNQIKLFKKDGFLIVENVIKLNLLKNIQKKYKKIFDENYQTGIVPDKIKWKKGRDKKLIPRSVSNVWKVDKSFAKLVFLEDLAFIAAKLRNWKSSRINQDCMIWLVPNAGCVNFHQDNSYQDWHTPGGVITCWVPLTDTKENSGTLEYFVGSHKKKVSVRLKNFFGKKNYRYPINHFLKKNKKEKIRTMDLKAGSVVFHHGKIWHGSGYNRTNKDRISISIHFMSGNSKFHPKIISPYFNRYKTFGSLKMEESFFPITWSSNKKVSKFIKKYLNH